MPVVSSLTTDTGLPAISTNSMTWTAIAAGGTAPLEYQFWRFRQGSGWTLARGYSPSPIYVWTPMSGEEGTYHLQVWVRSAGSTAPFEAWLNAVGFQVVPPKVLRLQGQSGDFIVGSSERLVTFPDANFTQGPFTNFVGFQVTSTTDPSVFWQTNFAAPGGVPLVPGVYSGGRRLGAQGPTEPGMSVLAEDGGKFVCQKTDGSVVLVTWKPTKFVKGPCVKLASGNVTSLSLLPTMKSPDWPWRRNTFGGTTWNPTALSQTRKAVSSLRCAPRPADDKCLLPRTSASRRISGSGVPARQRPTAAWRNRQNWYCERSRSTGGRGNSGPRHRVRADRR